MPDNMSEIKINKNSTVSKFLIAINIVLIILIIGIGINFLLMRMNRSELQMNGSELQKNASNIAGAIIQPVFAQEIYPMFICPCCGKTIDVGCCGMAEERQLYVDALTQGRLSKEEVIAAYVKKYGLDSFKDEKQKQEFREKLIQEAPADRPVISVTPESYDFGDVSQTKGEVNALFEIINTGRTDLTINKLETSCGCTSASIIYQGKEGPIFSMPGHGEESPSNWYLKIPAGEKANLKVYYNPNIHQDFRGTAIREIYIFSNDPIDFETKVKIELNQID